MQYSNRRQFLKIVGPGNLPLGDGSLVAEEVELYREIGRSRPATNV